MTYNLKKVKQKTKENTKYDDYFIREVFKYYNELDSEPKKIIEKKVKTISYMLSKYDFTNLQNMCYLMNLNRQSFYNNSVNIKINIYTSDTENNNINNKSTLKSNKFIFNMKQLKKNYKNNKNIKEIKVIYKKNKNSKIGDKERNLIFNIFQKSKGSYGRDRITDVLNKKYNIKVGKDLVSKIMKEMNLYSNYNTRQKVTFNKRPTTKLVCQSNNALISTQKSKTITCNETNNEAYNNINFFQNYNLSNLIINLDVQNINKIWTSDITYIKTIKEGFVYLCTIMDYYSRKIISFILSKKMDVKLVNDTLIGAVNNRGQIKNIILHTDRGTQYRSLQYINLTNKYKILRSYTDLKRKCADNARHESFHSILKKELISKTKLLTFDTAKENINEYLNYYNEERIHTKLNFLSPSQFEYNIKQKGETYESN
ncbi:MAG: IS3 family transposase [Eubacteriales bacterium]|nr:IS3 family transposase [Eubacteriales bacterium]